MTCPVEKREGRVVSSAAGNNGTGQRGLRLDPIDPLRTMSGATPSDAGAPRSEGIVVVENKGSKVLTEEARKGPRRGRVVN